MKTISRNAIIGYPAGIITGITYGLNPLFAVPLMRNGASIESILFFRYGFAVVILGLFLMFTKHSFKITAKQAGVLLALDYYILQVVCCSSVLTTISLRDLPRRLSSCIPFWWHSSWCSFA